MSENGAPEYLPIKQLLKDTPKEFAKNHYNVRRQERFRYRKKLEKLSRVRAPEIDWWNVRAPSRRLVSIPMLEEYRKTLRKIIRYHSLRSGYDFDELIRLKFQIKKNLAKKGRSQRDLLNLKIVNFAIAKTGVPRKVQVSLEALTNELERRRTPGARPYKRMYKPRVRLGSVISPPRKEARSLPSIEQDYAKLMRLHASIAREFEHELDNRTVKRKLA